MLPEDQEPLAWEEEEEEEEEEEAVAVPGSGEQLRADPRALAWVSCSLMRWFCWLSRVISATRASSERAGRPSGSEVTGAGGRVEEERLATSRRPWAPRRGRS